MSGFPACTAVFSNVKKTMRKSTPFPILRVTALCGIRWPLRFKYLEVEAGALKISGNGTVTMSYDEYDLYEESAENCGYLLTEWYPSMESAQKMISQFTDNVLFIIWVLHSPLGRELTEKEKKIRSFLNSELNHRLVLTD